MQFIPNKNLNPISKKASCITKVNVGLVASASKSTNPVDMYKQVHTHREREREREREID
jgi:hypothetical protein